MAYIRAHETAQRKKGKPVKRYEVCWREPVHDAFGLPVPENPDHPEGSKKMRSRQESYASREEAEARRDELNAARHTTGTSTLADQKKAGDLTFGYYAQAWLDSLQVRVNQGRLKQRTYDDCRKRLRHYVLDRFGPKAIASITPRDCEEFLAVLVNQRCRQGTQGTLAPATVAHAWGILRSVMRYALRHDAILSNPCERVDFAAGRATGDHARFEHHPLTAAQVAALCDAIAGEGIADLPAYPVYGLMVALLAYTGLRAAENAGLEVRDLVFKTAPNQPVRASVQVRRTKDRRDGGWLTGTPKSKRSRRSVPLPPWLAERMHAYLATEHPRADEPDAPLWPGRTNAGGWRATRGENKTVRREIALDWSEPIDMTGFYRRIFRPALEAVGLPASTPAQTLPDGTPVPAERGVRLHDLRHSFATMHLMAGTHFMQVSKWLGHATYTLTLNTYGDWIPEEDAADVSHLPEPPSNGNVVSLPRRIG
ncbi:tyrosine-type recombinase/integrase [Mycobacterium sp. URHB0021]